MKSMKKEEIDKMLGDIFKKYRLKNGLTQEIIAEKLGISVKYISRIENGTGGVKVETLINYINVLGVSPNIIFDKLIVNENLIPQIQLSKIVSTLSNEKILLLNDIANLLKNI